jgi:1-aminocyclopropane-1-carboxylate deaminase
VQQNFQLPSSVHAVPFSAFAKAEIFVFLKRDDLIHPIISGNKWRKLKYNMKEAAKQGAQGIVTFGGAYSNHLVAAAFAAQAAGMPMVAMVRGEEAVGDAQNTTMAQLRSCGAEVVGLTREAYSKKEDPLFLAELAARYPNHFIIPEGGANLLGLRGCMEILHEVTEPFNVVAAPLGTATTFAGLLASGFAAQQFLGFPAIKGGDYLNAHVENFLMNAKQQGLVPDTLRQPAWQLVTDYHFGGFGKMPPELIAFMNHFFDETGIPLDPVYTAKMMLGLANMAQSGCFAKGTRILALHTGGLQGIAAANKQLRAKKLKIAYENVVASATYTPTN